MNAPRALIVTTALLALAAGPGCSYFAEWKVPALAAKGKSLQGAEDWQPRPYPEPKADALATPLDIEVVPVGNAIRIDNRSVASYADAELWLNQQYGARLDRVEIGRNDLISLKNFVNEHGERYPTSRLLDPDALRPLVAADLIVDGQMHKLYVRLDDWRHP